MYKMSYIVILGHLVQIKKEAFLQKFEDTIKEEAHQKALKTGTNPAALASGTRNGTQNSTSNATSVLKSKDASKDTEERLTTKELEELEAEFEDDDEEEEDEEEQVRA